MFSRAAIVLLYPALAAAWTATRTGSVDEVGAWQLRSVISTRLRASSQLGAAGQQMVAVQRSTSRGSVGSVLATSAVVGYLALALAGKLRPQVRSGLSGPQRSGRVAKLWRQRVQQRLEAHASGTSFTLETAAVRAVHVAKRSEVAVGPERPHEDTHSPFETGSVAAGSIEAGSIDASISGGKKPKLPLTWENVEAILDELRPYLQNDGGDCKIVEIDGPVVRLEMQGACSSCSASAVTLKVGIERTLVERIPEITEVVAVLPDQELLTDQGLEEVIDGIRPYLKNSGGSLDVERVDGADGPAPRVFLRITGPPSKSIAVRVDVTNRVKRRFPMVQEVEFVGG